ncbi:Nlrc5 [Symbiodinium sp. CCMP2592]|nr:Nlrc5 [Symbiodinium sp. CCMP2592]
MRGTRNQLDKGDSGATCLAAALSHLTSLRELHVGLWSTGLGRGQRRPTGPEGVGSLAEALEKLPELAKLGLDLGRNELGDAAATCLAAALSGLTSLRELDVDLCDIGLSRGHRRQNGGLEPNQRAVSVQICSWKGASREVRHAGLEGAGSLAESLGKLPELAKLRLDLTANHQLGRGLQRETERERERASPKRHKGIKASLLRWSQTVSVIERTLNLTSASRMRVKC